MKVVQLIRVGEMNQLTDDFFRQKLTTQQYMVLRQSATEAPFSGQFDDFWQTGKYYCAACHTLLFQSDTKYDAGCGWPSFWQAVDDSKIKLVKDKSHFMIRTEVRCRNCNSHLGHLFDDGPQDKGGARYCINSSALDFKHDEK